MFNRIKTMFLHSKQTRCTEQVKYLCDLYRKSQHYEAPKKGVKNLLDCLYSWPSSHRKTLLSQGKLYQLPKVVPVCSNFIDAES